MSESKPVDTGAILTAILALSTNMLDGIEHRPRMYAIAPESLEIQARIAVELRQKILRPKALAADPRETRRAYERFVAMINGDEISWPLFVVLREAGKLHELPRLLGDFARWVAVEYPPEWSP